jgi:membrane protein YdbS with pleckstrin-like domain
MTTRLDPPNATWLRVSSKLIVAELISAVIFWLIVIAAGIVFLVVGAGWAPWAIAAAAVLLVVNVTLIARRVRAYGYQLRADDLVFRRGIMFHRVVSVPYGRMQLIDINRGPITRALGLSELKFVTAAASSAVVIPGLPESEAEQLRDRLVALAESRRAGL